MKITVMELPVTGNIFVDRDGVRYILANVVDNGETYPVLVDIDLGLAYVHFDIMRSPN